jgi:hypothetical protein
MSLLRTFTENKRRRDKLDDRLVEEVPTVVGVQLASKAKKTPMEYLDGWALPTLKPEITWCRH